MEKINELKETKNWSFFLKNFNFRISNVKKYMALTLFDFTDEFFDEINSISEN